MGKRVASTSSFDFGPYAQILKTLLPRSRVIYLYAPDGDLLWSSDGTDSADLQPRIVELLESAKANPALDRLSKHLALPNDGWLLAPQDLGAEPLSHHLSESASMADEVVPVSRVVDEFLYDGPASRRWHLALL